jgi:predicted ATPase
MNSALHPILEHLETIAEFTSSDSADSKLRKFEALADRLGYSPEETALLTYLLSLPGSERHPRQDLTPQARMDATLRALADLVVRFAQSHPVHIVVEDLHWIDPTSLALLDLMVERIRHIPILMMLTFRPEFTAKWEGSHISHLVLGNLSPRETLDMLLQLTGGKPLPAAVCNHILAKTDGVPLFVEELTKAILESDIVRDAGDSYRLAVNEKSVTVPSTLRDSLMARLDRLGSAKEVAQIGAAIGRSFPYELIAGLTHLSAKGLSETLHQLAVSGLIVPHGAPPMSNYTFKHALFQDTAYDSLLRARRRTLHAQIARVMVELWPEATATQPEILAHHYAAAGDTELAIQFWLKAARRSAERGSPAEAIGHYENALELIYTWPPTPDRHKQELAIRIALVTPTMSLKGYCSRDTEIVIANARTLAERLGETGQIFAIMYAEWVSTFARGKIESSRGLAEHFMALAQSQADTTPLVVAHRMLGATLVNLGEFSGGQETLEGCIKLYRPRLHGAAAFVYGQDSRVSALSFLSWALLIQGYSDKALKAARRAVSYAEKTQHAHSQAVALCLAGLFTRIMMRDTEGVREHAGKALALTAQQGLAMWLAAATIAEGWLVAQDGLGAEGIQKIRKGLDGLQAMGVGILRPFFLNLLAEAYGRCGEIGAGLDAVSEAFALTEAGGERIWDADLHRVNGELLLAQGGIDAEKGAEAMLLKGISIAQKQGAQFWKLRAATSLALLWSRQTKGGRARDLLEPICSSLHGKHKLHDLETAKGLLCNLP